MTAMSPGCRRRVRRLVRASTRAGPTTAGSERLCRRWAMPSAPPLARCGGQQLFGVVARCGTRWLARQHAGELDHALAFADDACGRHGASVLLLFRDRDLFVGERRDLRKMGDNEDLMV